MYSLNTQYDVVLTWIAKMTAVEVVMHHHDGYGSPLRRILPYQGESGFKNCDTQVTF